MWSETVGPLSRFDIRHATCSQGCLQWSFDWLTQVGFRCWWRIFKSDSGTIYISVDPSIFVDVDLGFNKTGARQYTRNVLSIFAEIHSIHPISAYIFLLSPTLGLPPRFIDALFGVTGISGLNLWCVTHHNTRVWLRSHHWIPFALVFTCTFAEWARRV